MKLSQLNALVAVAKVRTLHEAARSIGLSQPALSKIIRALEEELGAALLFRNASGVSLTPYGHLVIKRARGIQKEIDRLWDEVSTLKHQMGGRLSVGLTALASSIGVAAITGRVRRQHPSIELEFIDMRPQQIVEALREGTLDLGLLTLYDRTAIAGFDCHLLRSFPSVLVGRRRHAAAVTPIARLLAEEWVDSELCSHPEGYIETIAANAGLARPPVIHRCTSLNLGIGLALELDAIGHAAELALPHLQQFAGGNRISRIETDVPLPAMNIVLAHVKEDFLTPAAREAARILRASRPGAG